MKKKLCTVHIETGMNSLGGPTQVVYLVDGLIRRGHEANLICPAGSGIHQEMLAAGLPVVPIRFRNELDITLFFKILSFLRKSQPDIVHLHSRRGADFWGGIAARICKTSAVILSRRVDYPINNRFISKLKYGYLCDKIITVSNAIREILIAGGVEPSKIVCVHSTIDASVYGNGGDGLLRKELGIPEDALLIGIIAQLIERKGHKYLFEAFPTVLKKCPNARLLVLGKGVLLPKLKQHAERLGIADKVIFAGFRRDIPRILSELDLLVHPAIMEGLGVAILQAMAAGLPVIATPVGGIPEVVRDGVSGLLIPPKDSDALGQAILSILPYPDVRRHMGEEGRRIVREQFSVDRMVDRTLRVYEEVLVSKGIPVQLSNELTAPHR